MSFLNKLTTWSTGTVIGIFVVGIIINCFSQILIELFLTTGKWCSIKLSSFYRCFLERASALKEPRTTCPSNCHPGLISDFVYSFRFPCSADAEILFFHGLPWSDENAHWSGWTTRNDPLECWPGSWLSDHFPKARVLSISYTGICKALLRNGRLDMHTTAEFLLSDIIVGANIGQNCSVVLVGHGVGGLVIKEVCLQAQRLLDSDPTREDLRKFLKNLKGMLFYSTPHDHPSSRSLAEMADIVSRGWPRSRAWPWRGDMLRVPKSVTLLEEDAARINEQFAILRRNNGWKTFGVGEADATRVNCYLGPFQYRHRYYTVVGEASASHDMDMFVMASGDHFSVCKPEDRSGKCFLHLVEFINEILGEV